MKTVISPYTAFQTASDLTQAAKETTRLMRQQRRGSDQRRETRRLIFSQAAYRDYFLTKVVVA